MAAAMGTLARADATRDIVAELSIAGRNRTPDRGDGGGPLRPRTAAAARQRPERPLCLLPPRTSTRPTHRRAPATRGRRSGRVSGSQRRSGERPAAPMACSATAAIVHRRPRATPGRGRGRSAPGQHPSCTAARCRARSTAGTPSARSATRGSADSGWGSMTSTSITVAPRRDLGSERQLVAATDLDALGLDAPVSAVRATIVPQRRSSAPVDPFDDERSRRPSDRRLAARAARRQQSRCPTDPMRHPQQAHPAMQTQLTRPSGRTTRKISPFQAMRG